MKATVLSLIGFAICFFIVVKISLRFGLFEFPQAIQPLRTKRIIIIGFIILLTTRLTMLFQQYLFVIISVSITLVIAIEIFLDSKPSKTARQQTVSDERFLEVFSESIQRLRNRLHEEKNRTQAISMLPNLYNSYESLSQAIAEYTKVSGENKYLSRFLDIKRHFVSALIASKVMDAENSGKHIDVEIGDYSMSASIDDYQLAEIIGTLIDNGIEASNSVLVRIYRQHDSLVTEVCNPHAPMPEDVLQKLFKRGYSSKGKDRGIGLYNLKTLVQNNNGSVIAFNKEINGTNHIVFKVII